jgi:hypothetical protein
MGRRKREGDWSIIYAEVPPELAARLEALARKNHRSKAAEVIMWLETLPPAPAVEPEPKRGRPRKP